MDSLIGIKIKTWITYISKKGQRYNRTVQCQIRHSYQGWKVLYSDIRTQRVAAGSLRIERGTNFNIV